jgi:DNA-binding SARP family transcriptional activator
VKTSGDLIWLARNVQVDLQYLVDCAHRLSGAAPVEVSSTLVARYGGELLPGWYDDWVISAQQWWQETRVRALEAIAMRAQHEGQLSLAVEAAKGAVHAAPLRETSRRILVEAYLREGNAGEAVLEYRRFAELLRKELSIDPSPDFGALLSGLLSRMSERQKSEVLAESRRVQ